MELYLTNAEMVKEFHKTFGLATRHDAYRKPSLEDQKLRLELLKEEFLETLEAIAQQDIENIAKELVDLLYVTYGALITYGVDADRAFREVHRSNMSKVGPNGEVLRREDGKVIKPPTYSPADMKRVLNIPETTLKVVKK